MEDKYLLAADMDGTVIPLEAGREWREAVREFHGLMTGNPRALLAYVTGRHLELAEAGVAQFGLPEPDIYICDVGTTVYRKRDGGWYPDPDYRQRLLSAWGNRTGRDIALMLADIPELTPQESEKQKEFKQSYYLGPAEDPEAMSERIRQTLAAGGIESNIIYSVDSLKNVGLVDVLPAAAAKDHALDYLCGILRLARERVVYAGDSGNDLRAFVSGYPAIVVANTPEPVKREVRRRAAEKLFSGRIYFAGDRYVRGVMEGCRHFGLL